MPPVEDPNKDPLTQLLDDIELLSAQTRSLELSLQRAQTSAFEEVERFQQQFRARVNDLKNESEHKSHSAGDAVELPLEAGSDLKNEELQRRFAEQQTALQHAHEESERRGAAIEALREQLSRFEAANRELEQAKNAAERELETSRRDAHAKLAALQSEIAHKTTLLTQNQSTIARLEEQHKTAGQSTGAREGELEALVQTQRAAIQRLTHELAELRASADQEKQTAASEIQKLRMEAAQKQILLEQRDNAHSSERELRNRYRELQGRLAAKESVIESHETHLHNAQLKLLETRDALAETQRALADLEAQARLQEQRFQEERAQWQAQVAEAKILTERYRDENERSKAELARGRETANNTAVEQQALRERAEQLSAEVNELTNRIREKDAALVANIESAGRREAELNRAVREAQEALALEQKAAREREERLQTELAELRLKLERQAEAVREGENTAARNSELEAQIATVKAQLHDAEQALEARAGEITTLNARVQTLTDEMRRAESERQAATDNADSRRWQEEIAELKSKNAQQAALLEERQDALRQLEHSLRAEIAVLKEGSAARELLLQTQGDDLKEAVEQAGMLRSRLAQLESAAREAEDLRVRASADAERIARLEGDLELARQKLAERETASDPLRPAHATDESAELQAARHKIGELLDRLAQLEAARQSLQENAAQELQELRESFEARISKLRMEMAEQQRARRDESPATDPQATAGDGEAAQKQIDELRRQLAEQHKLLEDRNEELIRVRGELHLLEERLNNSSTLPAMDSRPSVELREEDAIDAPGALSNGTSTAGPLQLAAAGGLAAPGRAGFRSAPPWSPTSQKDSAFGASRRWNIGVFKRRWKV